jgi:hypothetical protein
LIFPLQNGQRAEVSFFGAHGHLPMGVALLLAAVFGILLVALPGTARIVQLRMLSRRRAAAGPRTGRRTGRRTGPPVSADGRRPRRPGRRFRMSAARFPTAVVDDRAADRFHLVIDVIDRVPGLARRAAVLRQHMVDKRAEHRTYVRCTSEDLPEVREWTCPTV